MHYFNTKALRAAIVAGICLVTFTNLNAQNVGVGESSPTARLHVKSGGNTSATSAFKVYNSLNTLLFHIKDDGTILLPNLPGVMVKTDNTGVVKAAVAGTDYQVPVMAGIGIAVKSGDSIALTKSGVTAGTYGDATHTPQITVDAYGRVTTATTVAITSIGGINGVAAGGDLYGTYPNPKVGMINGKAIATVATSGSYTDLSNTPSSLPPSGTAGGDLGSSYPNPTVLKINGHTPATVATSGSYTDLINKPTYATVATSGSYNDLSNKPTSMAPSGTAGGDLTGSYPNPTVQKINGQTPATVATSGNYNDLLNRPTIPTSLPPSGTAQGDLSGTYPSPTVSKINGQTPATVATSGNYNDLNNRPSLATVATSGSYSDLTNKPTSMAPSGTAGGDLSNNYPNPTVIALQGKAVSSSSPSDAQMLMYSNSASKWAPVSMSGDATITSGGVITLSQNSNQYIKNQTASAQTAGFNINGAGTIGGALNVAGTASFTGSVNVSGLSASSIVLTDGSKNLTTASAPSANGSVLYSGTSGTPQWNQLAYYATSSATTLTTFTSTTNTVTLTLPAGTYILQYYIELDYPSTNTYSPIGVQITDGTNTFCSALPTSSGNNVVYPGSGFVEVTPASSTTYTLQVTNAAGNATHSYQNGRLMAIRVK